MYRRVLLKLSGEALMGNQSYGLAANMVHQVATDLIAVAHSGVEIAVVVGGGNFFRGIKGEAIGLDRTTSDHIGMLATTMNALALRSAIALQGHHAVVLSAVDMDTFCEKFTLRRAGDLLSQKSILIFAAGTGNPYFTTDTAAVLRAIELSCDLLLKGTKVDGLYDSDPLKNPEAKKLDVIHYDDVIEKDLRLMDLTGITLAQENRLPIAVFSIYREGMLSQILKGGGICSFVRE